MRTKPEQPIKHKVQHVIRAAGENLESEGGSEKVNPHPKGTLPMAGARQPVIKLPQDSPHKFTNHSGLIDHGFFPPE
jgi:hypothetical protein